MATKLFLALLATSLAFLLVADATILRTTVAEVEEENPFRGEGSSQCRQFRGMDLTPCMYWMQQSSHGGGWEVNPISSSSRYKNQCCRMLSNMDEACRCKVLKDMLQEECEYPSFQGSQGQLCSHKLMQKLKNVPQMCGLESETCHFRMLVA